MIDNICYEDSEIRIQYVPEYEGHDIYFKREKAKIPLGHDQLRGLANGCQRTINTAIDTNISDLDLIEYLFREFDKIHPNLGNYALHSHPNIPGRKRINKWAEIFILAQKEEERKFEEWRKKEGLAA